MLGPLTVQLINTGQRGIQIWGFWVIPHIGALEDFFSANEQSVLHKGGTKSLACAIAVIRGLC